MALYGKCNKCGTYFFDMFGEFYDHKTQELICPKCGSRDIKDVEPDESDDFYNLFSDYKRI